MDFSDLTNELAEKIKDPAKEKELFILAVDGRCASGKTTLANELAEILDCNVIHTDDFFLQGFQRTKERYAEPGGNLDRERLSGEVLAPLRAGKEVIYRPFICHSMSFGEEIILPRKKINIIEGSYSCHPESRKYYDLMLMLDVDSEAQKKRILNRDGAERLEAFIEKWIPLEENYFTSADFDTDRIIKYTISTPTD